MKLMKPILSLIFCAPVALLCSCQNSSTNSPNVVVIAAEGLGANQVNCSRDNHSSQSSGFDVLCKESVRFTHAYTTSPLSGPGLTSVLTGLYPFQSGVHDHGASFLPSSKVTVAELAEAKNISTAFFSGGAPLLRKLNLHQGFEVFDDHFGFSPRQLFRPLSESLEVFRSWMKDIGNNRFFTVFYAPDLLFTNQATQTNLGEKRDLTFESQLDEMDETLFNFIQLLKKTNNWDNTTFILVGLNGPDLDERGGELIFTNLMSERTQVSLLIKPAQKPRDEALNWTFDANVTLADVGETLREIYGQTRSPDQDNSDLQFPVFSLTKALQSPSTVEFPSRPILMETGWPAWRENTSIRYAIRWDHCCL